RASLHTVLMEHIKHSEIQQNKRLAKITQLGSAYRLDFEDNSHAMADIVIGADGIHSRTRTFVNPSSKTRYAGYVCWRAVIESAIEIESGFETWGKNGRFGAVPLSINRIYWFLCINADSPNQYQEFTKDDLARLF